MMKRLASMRLGFVSSVLFLGRGKGAGRNVRPHVSLGGVPAQILGVQHLDQVEESHAARCDRDTADSKDDDGADLLRLAHPHLRERALHAACRWNVGGRDFSFQLPGPLETSAWWW